MSDNAAKVSAEEESRGARGAQGAPKWAEGLLDVRCVAAVAFCFAWQNALNYSLFSTSAYPLASPQVVLALASFLTMLVAFRGQFHTQARQNYAGSARLTGVAVTAGSLAGCVCSVWNGMAPVVYACSLIMGAASALAICYLALPVAQAPSDQRIASVMAGLAVSSLLGLLIGLAASTRLAVVTAILLLGAGCVASLMFRPAGREAVATAAYRPTSTQHYRVLAFALVIYAFVFGSVTGSTGFQTQSSGVRDLAVQVAQSGIVIALICLLVVFLARRHARLEVTGRVLTPLLAILFIIHIVLPTEARQWLPPITLAFWQVVEVFVMLLLVEISQSGVGSLGLIFSAGWSVLAGGFLLGAVFGTASGAAFGTAEAAVNNITVLHTVLAVVASSLLAGARYPEAKEVSLASISAGEQGVSAVAASPAGTQAAALGTTPVAPVEPPTGDAIAQACQTLEKRYQLSEREGEVLELLARGNTRQSIADKLVVSENTVRTHVKNIYTKLHIHSKQQLIDMVDGMRSSAA